MNNLEEELQKLNKYQKQAVETLQGPVMVVAGPGTGKTQILALRIANILKQTDTTADSILCLTFTEAGAKAMRQRLIKFIGSDAYKVNINTFHGFANDVIQTFPEKFAFSKELKQLDDLNRLKIIREIIDNSDNLKDLKPFSNKYLKVRDIITAIQELKKEAVSPEQLLQINKRLKEDHEANIKMRADKPTQAWQQKMNKFMAVDELAHIYNEYQMVLQAEGYYDYEDMIIFVINKLKEDDSLLGHFQERYLYILVDEYQDTNGAQNEILNQLTKNDGTGDNSPNIFVVGDDDQAIYRFQGANLGNILFFSKNFSDAVTIPTPINYRSTQLILDIADSVIKNNSARLVNEIESLNKELKAGIEVNISQNQKAEIWEFNNSEEENISIAKEILNLSSKGVNFSDIAVLYRKNNHSEDINQTLNKFSIPTYIDNSKDIFETDSVKKFLDLLNAIVLYNKNQDEFIYKVLMSEYLSIDPVSVYKLCKLAYSNKTPIIELLLDTINDSTHIKSGSGQLTFIKEDSASNKLSAPIKNFAKELFEWHQKSHTMRLDNFVEYVLSESEILNYYEKTTKEQKFEDLIALNSFFQFVKSQNLLRNDLTLATLLRDIDLIKENRFKVSLSKISNPKDAVNLLTAHSSKGLEFDYVFITKFTSSNWGNTRSSNKILPPEIFNENFDKENEKGLRLEDERRLFFVALTRARKKIYMTYANEYENNGNKQSATHSQFITEISKDLVVNKSIKNEDFEVTDTDLVFSLKRIKPANYSSEEREFLSEQIKSFKLSASSLNEYLKSPEQFKLNRLIRVPQPKNKNAAMGTAIHYAMEVFNRSYIENLIPSKDFLVKNYSEKLYKEFFGDEEYEITSEEGKRILSEYYEEYLAKGLYTKALEVEYNFHFHNVYLEKEGIEPIPLSGRIDKLEQINDSESEFDVKVIDYKTGTDKTVGSLTKPITDKNGNEYRQIMFYKLLGDLDSQFRPNRDFNKPKYNIVCAEIDYLKRNKTTKKFRRVTIPVDNKSVEELKDLIVEVITRIRNLEFPEECDLI